MKNSSLVFLLTLLFSAQIFAQTTFQNYKAASEAGRAAFAAKKYDDSLAAYKAGIELGKTDTEKSNAMIGAGASSMLVKVKSSSGVGKFAREIYLDGDPATAAKYYEQVFLLKNPPIENIIKARYGLAGVHQKNYKYDEQRAEIDKVLALPNLTPDQKADAYIERSKTSYTVFSGSVQKKRNDLNSAIAVPGVTDELKAEAMLLMAEQQETLEVFSAVANYESVVKLNGATTGQKLTAYSRMANYYGNQKKFDQVIVIGNTVLALPGLKPEQKVDAHQLSAKAYFLMNDATKAEAEIAKVSALKGIDQKNLAAIYQETGDILAQYGKFAKARVEYEKTTRAITDPKSYIIGDLTNKIIKTYADEKNYKKAKEEIAKLHQMPDVDAWRKQAATMVLGEIYLEEKNFKSAGETYKTILADPKLGALRELKALSGAARAAYGLKDTTAAKTYYQSLLSKVTTLDKASNPNQMKMSPAEIGEYKRSSAAWRTESKAKIAELDAKAAVN